MLWGVINYCRGFVRVEICGAAIERFLNICAQNDIDFWDLKRVSCDKIRASVENRSFRRLPQFSQRMMCTVEVISKRGVPFELKALLPRFFLWGGAIFFAVSLFTLTKFIWVIDTEQCEPQIRDEAVMLVREAGLSVGILKTSIDSDDIRTYALSKSDTISYLAVNVRGSRAEIVAEARVAKPELVPIDEPCDIISDKSGVIIKQRVAKGLETRKIGESVEAGETLVNGTIINELGEWFRVHSQADIALRTWKSVETIMPTRVQSKVPTGEIKKRYSIVAFSRRFALNIIEKEPFSCYDKFIEEKEIAFGHDIVLPFSIICEKYVEYTPLEFTVTEPKCSEILQQRQKETLQARAADAEIIGESFEYKYGENFATGKTTLECSEKAGILKTLVGAPEPDIKDVKQE